jgi:hypothetical protein
MDSNLIKFPYSASRRVHSRRPRTSKNGTPEERASLPKTVVEEIREMVVEEIEARSLSITAENGRLRKERYEVWRRAEAATHYWEVRMKFEDAVLIVQQHGLPEGCSHPAVEIDGHWPLIDGYRAALVKQLLTPAPDAASIKWKQSQLARGKHRFSDVKPARLERAILDDLAFLAAHPVRQSNRGAGRG